MITNVLIPKGTLVQTTHSDGARLSKRNQTVKTAIFPTTTEVWWSAGRHWRWVEISIIVATNPVVMEYMDEHGA